MTADADNILAALLLPGRLEGFAREDHARGLLSIPRVVALEASRLRPPRFLRDVVCQRQARRLRFPGRLRLLVLYHPAQYPLARALCVQYQDLDLWYIPPAPGTLAAAGGQQESDLASLDELARARATQVLPADAHHVEDGPLRARLLELKVINPRAFIPKNQPAPGARGLPGSRRRR